MKERSILMFCPQFRPVVGGAERQAEKLAIALAAAGCRVCILTPRLDPDSPDVEEVQGVRIERFPLMDLSRHWPVSGIALINIPFILWQVFRAVRSRLRGIHVLHAHLASLQTEGALLAARLARIPALCKAATADRRSDLGELEKQGAGGRLAAWLIRNTLPCWVATTQAVEQALIRAGIRRERIARIPNGVEVQASRAEGAHSDSARRFLYLGRLSTNTRRDTLTLIRAFERLARTMPNTELALVGKGDLLEATRAQAAACKASERIRIPGFDAPEKWLAWANCFILPSRLEGLSNALLEAMAMGLPCIANDIPPNREVLAEGRAGILVPVGDEERLYQEMLRMATDGDHVVALARRAVNRVRAQYSIGAVAERYIAFYDHLAQGSVS